MKKVISAMCLVLCLVFVGSVVSADDVPADYVGRWFIKELQTPMTINKDNIGGGIFFTPMRSMYNTDTGVLTIGGIEKTSKGPIIFQFPARGNRNMMIINLNNKQYYTAYRLQQ